jgi:Zn-dependent protease
MAEKSPSPPRMPLSFGFRLGPFPVVVEPTFFLAPLVAFRTQAWMAFAWIALIFASVLVHELGHALAARRFGARASIRLYGLGGLTTHSTLPQKRQRLLVALAGSAAGFLPALLALALQRLLPPAAAPVLQPIFLVNFAWGVINLLPVPPLDGGHVLEELLGPRQEVLALQIGAVVAVLAAAEGYRLWGWVAAVLFALLSLRCVVECIRLAAQQRIQRQLTRLRNRMWEEALPSDDEDAGHRAALRETMQELHDASRQLPTQPEPDQDRDPALLARIFEELGLPARAAEHAVDAHRRDPSDASALQAVRLLVAAGRHPEAEALVTRTRWSAEAARAEAEALLQSPSPTRSRH